jgi:carbon-monoxide dehydrogenase small subunit
MSDLVSYRLTVNGTERNVTDGVLSESLLFVLRERLGLAGSKNACEQGECGSCSILLDGELVCSCLVMAATVEGRTIKTIESLSPDGALSDVQQAFIDAGAVQCGFCTPGLIVTVHELLDRSLEADEFDIREALAGNLCRCTGYGRILKAVQLAATGRKALLEGSPDVV